MPPITVDPNALSGAGESIGAVGDEIAAAISTLVAGLSSGARSGLDPAGLAFGHTYQQSAQALLDAGAAAVNAGRGIGFGVQMSATNYSRADAASTIGGGASTLTPPDAPAEFSAPASPSAVGGGVPPPLLWSVIEGFIPDVWPDGDPAALRATASAWQSFASTMNGIAGQLAGPSGVVAGQQIPEGGNMTSAVSELTQSLSGIASEAGKLATQTMEFADDVENTQNAIRDLLDRVSPSRLWDGFKAVLSGDALEELKEIAEDIKTVLGDYGRQAEARRDMLQIAMGMIDDAVVAVEKWARREFPRYLGDDVGNALATALDFELTLGQGILAGAVDTIDGIGQLDPLRFAYDREGAKETWGALAEDLGKGLLYATPTGVAGDPVGAFNYYKDQVTDAVHAEDWSSDRSGYGLGKIFFDVGASVVPGGAATRTGSRIAGEAADAAKGPHPGRIPGVPGGVDNIVPIGQTAEGITTKLNNLDKPGDNIPTATTSNPTGPPIPPDLVEPPSAPHAGDTPTPTPRAPDAPTSHVPGSTPGDRTPVAPHSSTPTGTPAHPPAGTGDAPPRTSAAPIGAAPDTRVPSSADVSTGPTQSALAPPAGTPHAMASNMPEPAPVAPHAPSSMTSGHAPQTTPAAGHAPDATLPDSTPPYPHSQDSSSDSSGGGDHGDSPGGGDHGGGPGGDDHGGGPGGGDHGDSPGGGDNGGGSGGGDHGDGPGGGGSGDGSNSGNGDSNNHGSGNAGASGWSDHDPNNNAHADQGDDGSWHNADGASLDPVQNRAADEFLDQARQAEPRITESMRQIADRLDGGELIGQEYRLKTEDSFKEKLAGLIDEMPDKQLSEQLADMKDAVRYTIQSSNDVYTDTVKQAMNDLVSQGYECIKVKNSWGDSGYQGINSFWRDPATGQVFELQFHTPSSFDAKMSTHQLYEEQRQPLTSDARRAELASQQAEIFDRVVTPPGAPQIQPPTIRGAS